jgi:hypothetical protein
VAISVEESGRVETKRLHQGTHTPTLALPAALGIAADLGFALSLIFVLTAWGPIGTLAAVALGVLALAGVITFTVLRLGGRKQSPRSPANGLAYAFVRHQTWEPGPQRDRGQ